MCEYFLVMKGNNKDLACKEFETLWEVYFNERIFCKNIENVLFSFSSVNMVEKNSEFLKRLTYTNFLGISLCRGDDLEKIEKSFKLIDKESFNNKSFSLRFKKAKSTLKLNFEEKDMAEFIWNNLKNPSINLKTPQVEFNLIFANGIKELILCENLFENEKDYSKRMPNCRPVKMPYTLKSDMARAVVNLLALKEGIILDPFCGIGGILLEAYDMNFQVIGNDISWNDLKYMKKNFEYFYPNSSIIRTLADSTTQFLKEDSIDGIVTDIPYGKSSRKFGEDLYENFLKKARIYLKPGKKLVIIYANFLEFRTLALKYFEEIFEIDEYINKSMTRHILVLENTKSYKS